MHGQFRQILTDKVGTFEDSELTTKNTENRTCVEDSTSHINRF